MDGCDPGWAGFMFVKLLLLLLDLLRRRKRNNELDAQEGNGWVYISNGKTKFTALGFELFDSSHIR